MQMKITFSNDYFLFVKMQYRFAISDDKIPIQLCGKVFWLCLPRGKKAYLTKFQLKKINFCNLTKEESPCYQDLAKTHKHEK